MKRITEEELAKSVELCQWLSPSHLREFKINILPHEFFLYHFSKVTRIGWRVKKKIARLTTQSRYFDINF